MQKIKLLFAAFLFSFALTSCATGSVIVTGTTRPAVNSDEVRILLASPSQYEVIGLVEASSNVEFSRQAAQDRVMNELRRLAGGVGANGVLLTATGDQAWGGAWFDWGDGGGIFVQGQTIIGRGMAVLIIQE